MSSELSFFTLPNCFELFGFDLLVDKDWHLWLLEVSHIPCDNCPEEVVRACNESFSRGRDSKILNISGGL